MVGGAHGQTGHHVMQHAVVVKGPDNVIVTILPPQGVGVIVMVPAVNNRFATLETVQVRPLKVDKASALVLCKHSLLIYMNSLLMIVVQMNS